MWNDSHPQIYLVGGGPRILILAMLIFAVSADAQQHAFFQNGDIIAGGLTPVMFVADGRFDWFLPDGALNKRMAAPFNEWPSDFAFDSAGNLYSPTFFTVRIFDATGRFARNFPRFPANWFTGIVFDKQGNAYISGSFNTGNLAKVDAAGNLLRTFALPSGIGVFDLAADQCTIFYSSGNRIFRYDVCNAAPLPDFVSIPEPGRLRILPDGTLLVASSESLLRVNGSGAIVQSYQVPIRLIVRARGIALDVDGRSFWTTSDDMALKFDIASGAVLASFRSSDYSFLALTVVGEPRAALVGGPAPIPVLSMWMLVVLTCCLAVAGTISAKSLG